MASLCNLGANTWLGLWLGGRADQRRVDGSRRHSAATRNLTVSARKVNSVRRRSPRAADTRNHPAQYAPHLDSAREDWGKSIKAIEDLAGCGKTHDLIDRGATLC